MLLLITCDWLASNLGKDSTSTLDEGMMTFLSICFQFKVEIGCVPFASGRTRLRGNSRTKKLSPIQGVVLGAFASTCENICSFNLLYAGV